ncbi:MAG: hypothetical protein KAY24_09625, partial [Candidatus Eisenbacteria sp.]|nr:hypothetical protein [Candidatus Eisenbacteria bacterium]
GMIQINKNLTITGATTPSKPTIKPTTDTGTANAIGPTGRGWFQIHGGATVDFENLIFDGTGKLVHTAVHYHGDSAGGTVESCDFTDIAHTPSGYQGRGINNYGQHVDVLNCTFSDILRIGVFTFNSGATTYISGCTYTGKGDGDWLDYAFEAGNGGNITVEGSSVTDCRGVASVDGSVSAGILVTDYFGPGTEAAITGNTLTCNTMGIAVGHLDTDQSVVVAHYNNIVGNTLYGVLNVGEVTVNATYNWWGADDGPRGFGPGTGDAVSANVDYDPWLTAAELGLMVTTQAATAITKDSATMNMSYALGPYSEVNVCFAYKKAADATWTETSWVSKSASGSHAVALTGLDSGTLYDFKAQLKYDTTVIEGAKLQFSTQALVIPTVSTQDATAIGTDSATLNLNYTVGDYSSVQVSFAWKKAADATWTETSWVSKSASGSHAVTLSGLDSGTLYDFKAQLEYDTTMMEGAKLQFTTDTPPPSPCFIATAAYGTPTDVRIDVLREFRDVVLLESAAGSRFVTWYYQTSPPIAEFIAGNEPLRALVRVLLVDPVVWLVQSTGAAWRN